MCKSIMQVLIYIYVPCLKPETALSGFLQYQFRLGEDRIKILELTNTLHFKITNCR